MQHDSAIKFVAKLKLLSFYRFKKQKSCRIFLVGLNLNCAERHLWKLYSASWDFFFALKSTLIVAKKEMS
jgi:hypothetical protein